MILPIIKPVILEGQIFHLRILFHFMGILSALNCMRNKIVQGKNESDPLINKSSQINQRLNVRYTHSENVSNTIYNNIHSLIFPLILLENSRFYRGLYPYIYTKYFRIYTVFCLLFRHFLSDFDVVFMQMMNYVF